MANDPHVGRVRVQTIERPSDGPLDSHLDSVATVLTVAVSPCVVLAPSESHSLDSRERPRLWKGARVCIFAN